ncbi:MAG TPA: MaoC/PaaZ C-terminal domain-containing protein [Syntrophorhabdus sp.]|jgi:acyl dehydratase|nr:MaoC/PaaZ C-terminal domain-containing protein [Syntrophorhabdus sp.]HQH83283.1 MaoC/PaaZ C-terminal domain-containing protein [Syntrophorhabdus sp.]
MTYRVRGRTFDDFVIDEEIISGARTVTEADVVNFACLSGDFHPEHMNKEYARKGPLGERIAHGLLITSMATGLLNQTGAFEGTTIAILEVTVRFIKAVKFGDTIRAIQKVVQKKETSKHDRGVLTSLITVLNQDNQIVLEADLVALLYRRGFVPMGG